MSNIKHIRNKIFSVQNTQKITKAMEMVAASKMRKTHEYMLSSYPYVRIIRKIMDHLTLGNLEYKHPYVQDRNVKCIGYFVVSTDHGLAGGLNINLFKKLLSNIEQHQRIGIDIKLALIGSKAISFFESIKNKIVTKIFGIGDMPKISKLITPIKIMLKLYDENHVDQLYIVSNKLISTISQVPQINKIIPLSIEGNTPIHRQTWDYLYESDPKVLLDNLLYRYIISQIYQSIIENLASEQAARMVAMKTATDNANNLIKDLKFISNKIRQTSITQELNEIISGVSAF